MTKCALICGAGGFIGGHLVKRLKNTPAKRDIKKIFYSSSACM
jgi:nucleoside-diphosphate-sugar epimerase